MFPDRDNNGADRIRPDDELIERPVVQGLMGGISTSGLYDDPDLMRLKVSVTAATERTRAVRWIKREVLELRAQRVARSEQKAAVAQAQTEQRRARRRIQQK